MFDAHTHNVYSLSHTHTKQPQAQGLLICPGHALASSTCDYISWLKLVRMCFQHWIDEDSHHNCVRDEQSLEPRMG